MPLSSIKTGVAKKHDVEFSTDEFKIDIEKGDFITVHYYKLGFEDDEFYLPENLPESSFRMVVDRFSCDYSGSFATNAICDDGKDGKKTFVSSDGQVTFGDYVSAVWYKIEVH